MVLKGEGAKAEPPRRGARSVAALVREKRVLVCVGTGGVGKTTIAATLAVAAARAGRKTLCLTIDPARRLAQGLGIEAFAGTEVVVDVPSLEGSGRGSLTVMMLDGGLTFDELVGKYAPSKQIADGVREHKIYRYLSRHLAGTQSYMAMEKVLAVASEESFDLVVLDTPPSERALDFFDAPERLREVLDSPLTQFLAKAVNATESFRVGWLSRGVGTIVDAVGKVTGSGLLRDLGSLLATMNTLFGGFGDRADRIKAKLRGSDFGYVLVTAPEMPRVEESIQLGEALGSRGLALDAILLNRFPPSPGELPELSTLEGSDEIRALSADPTFPLRLLKAGAEQALEHGIAEGAMRALRAGLSKVERPPLFLPIAQADYELHEIVGLTRLSAEILETDPSRSPS